MAESESQSDLVLELAEEFLERYRKGERPRLKEYIDRHPELSAEIREVFPAMTMMEKIAVADDSLIPNAQGRPSFQAQGRPSLGMDAPVVQLGDYRIIREIGHGGMGVVYEAEQVSLGRHVALKVLPHKALANAKTRQRFEREARAAAKLHHTNIVPVFGIGEHEGLPYYAMQFIQGTGLDIVIKELAHLRITAKSSAGANPSAPRPDVSVMAQSLLTGVYHLPGPGAADIALTCDAADVSANVGPVCVGPVSPSASTVTPSLDRSDGTSSPSLSGLGDSSTGSRSRKLTYWQSVARVGAQVADALEYAHKQGVVHRDIKPANLLLDMAGTVWVTDFGLAKADDQANLTHTGDLLGTFRYMPPEAFEGQSDARGDVYSLGMTLYEMVGLRPAFDEQDRKKLIKQVTTSEPPPVGSVRSGVPRDLETIIHKAIDREPARRYQKAEELAEDLRRFLEDRPVKARRISSAERLSRWARRNPVVAASLGGVAVIFLTAFVLVSWSYVRAEESRHVAEGREQAERWERYRASMIAAGSAMQLHNVTAAESALNVAPAEHRNWEWRYFNHQLDTSRQVLRLGDRLQNITISPDGTLAAVQSGSGPARFWDLTAQREIGSLGNTSAATGFWFSPDGKILAYELGERFFLWDVVKGRQRAMLSMSGKRVTEVRISTDGTLLAAGGDNRTVDVWDTRTGEQLLALRGHEAVITDVAFCPDGKLLASVGDLDRAGRLWDAATGKLRAVLTPHEGPVSQVLFSPQGDRVLTVEAYPGNGLRLWNAASGELLGVMRGHTNAAEKVAFSPDGKLVASAGLDRSVRIWNAHTGQPLASREGHRDAISSLAFSPDGKYVITGSKDQTARLWDAATGVPLGVLHGHTGSLYEKTARYSLDGQTLLTASAADGTLRFWDARRAEWNSSLRGHDSFVYTVAFHPDGERVASGAWDGVVRIWEATTGRQIAPLRFPFAADMEFKVVSSVNFHPAGKLVAAFGRDGVICFWDLATAEEAFRLRMPPGEHYGAAPRMAFSTRGHLLAASAGGFNNAAHVWDVERRAEVAVLKGHTSWVLEACFSPDDTWLATSANDGTVRIWDVRTWQQIHLLEGHADSIHGLAVSRDGKWLASGSTDGTVRVWDTATWKQAADPLKHGTNIYGVAFTPDGTRLATACANNMIRFWDTKTFQLVGELDGHAAYVHQIEFSPDGTRLVSGSGDHTVRIWDSLSVQERAKATLHK